MEAFTARNLLTQPVNRLVFLCCLPVVGILGWISFMLVLGTALQYPGDVPEGIELVYFTQLLIVAVPALLVQYKRLLSIGFGRLTALVLGVPGIASIVFAGVAWPAPCLWFAILALTPPGFVGHLRGQRTA